MKILKFAFFVLIEALFLIPGISLAQFQAGGPSNPYVIEKNASGKTEIHSQYLDPTGSVTAPGSPLNPYVIKKNAEGQIEMHSKFPDVEGSVLAPGSPINPYVIENTPTGQTKMHSRYEDYGN